MPVQPQFSPNKTANTLTVRASTPVMGIIERMLEANDKPRAEVIIDVQILEISRERAKQYGLNLSAYAIGGIFSPEVAPADRHRRRSTSTPSRRASARPTSIWRAERAAQLPRERLAHQGAGQAAAARHRRAEGLAEPRRGRPDSDDDVHAAGDGRRAPPTR